MQANAYLTAMKGTEELEWLNEVSSVPLQQAIRHQQTAFTAFWNPEPVRNDREVSRAVSSVSGTSGAYAGRGPVATVP